jgi:hypothetical protein
MNVELKAESKKTIEVFVLPGMIKEYMRVMRGLMYLTNLHPIT